MCAGVVYWLDILMGFSTGFVVIHNLRRKVIRDPRLIAEYYVRYSTFFVDLLAALPLIAEVIIQSDDLFYVISYLPSALIHLLDLEQCETCIRITVS